MQFKDLDIIQPILNALLDEGYEKPTPIQQKAIPHILKGKDLLGCAQTGTGKTAAFAIPMLQVLSQSVKETGKGKKPIRALILTPTRELAIQIQESFKTYGKNLHLKNMVIFGGVNQGPQVELLHKGVDVVVATPGRLLDLMDQGFLQLNQLEIFVLDEADRMLDMGFVNEVKRIITKIPQRRQTLFFSATMPKEIQALANSILHQPEKVEVAPVSSTADTITQYLYYVEKKHKVFLLEHILKDKSIETALVFSRTKHGADKIVKELHRAEISAEAIHGNKSQNARQRALSNFKDRTTRILVATDIAARGIDIDDLTHVINFELPDTPETYVHRIGRTGRAGQKGISLSFCEAEETALLQDIQKLIGKQIPVETNHPFNTVFYEILKRPQKSQQQRRNNPRPNTGQGSPKKSGSSFKKSAAKKSWRKRP